MTAFPREEEEEEETRTAPRPRTAARVSRPVSLGCDFGGILDHLLGQTQVEVHLFFIPLIQGDHSGQRKRPVDLDLGCSAILPRR